MDILHDSIRMIHVREKYILSMSITIIRWAVVDETIHTIKESHNRYMIHVREKYILSMSITIISWAVVDETIHTIKESHNRYINII
jgi:hypothetical protein